MLRGQDYEAGRKWQKRRNRRALLGLLDEYFARMRDTSVLVDPIILSIFGESRGRISANDELYGRLYDAAMKRLGNPKMRSHIAMLGYEMCDGKNKNGFLPIAAAMDLLEFSYYCSDSIFDKGIYADRRMVEDKIIVSHLLVSMVFELLGNSISALDLEKKNISAIMTRVYRFVRDIYEGFFIENHNTEPSRYVYERRTYAYNYWEHILGISAIAACASKEKTEAVSNFGKYVGMAYMVTNDIADITKEFEDIRNGRYTLPNILFYEKADDNERKSFKRAFGNRAANEDELKAIGQIMVDLGIVEECQTHASKLIELALPHLGIFGHSRPKLMLGVATRAVYNNQWYRSMASMYGYQRTVAPCGLELAGITSVP